MDEERKTREYLLKVLCFQYKAIFGLHANYVLSNYIFCPHLCKRKLFSFINHRIAK